ALFNYMGNRSEISVLPCTWINRYRNFNPGDRRAIPSCSRMVHDSGNCLLYRITYGAGIIRHFNPRCSHTDWRSNVPDQLGTRNYWNRKIIIPLGKPDEFVRLFYFENFKEKCLQIISTVI